MTQMIKLFPINKPSLIKRMVIGALIGLTLITIFLSGTGEPNPEWGKYWWIRPIIIVPIAGAMGGAFNYFISEQDYKTDLGKILAIVISLIVFVIGLWMGSVLGLAGTYWN